jgi:hypothetical protein
LVIPVGLVIASAGAASQVLGLLVRGLFFGLPAYLLVLGIYNWTQSDEPSGACSHECCSRPCL